MFDATTQNQFDDRFAGGGVKGRCRDCLPPLLKIGRGKIAQPCGMRETLHMRFDLVRMPVDNPDRLEDSVAALRTELADAERGGGDIYWSESVCVVVLCVIDIDGSNDEGEALSHLHSLERAGIEPPHTRYNYIAGPHNPGLHFSPL